MSETDNTTSKGFLFHDYAKGRRTFESLLHRIIVKELERTNICGFHLNWKIMHVENKIEFTILWWQKICQWLFACTTQPDAFCFRAINIYVNCAIVPFLFYEHIAAPFRLMSHFRHLESYINEVKLVLKWLEKEKEKVEIAELISRQIFI